MPAELLDVPLVRHVYGVAYARRMHALFWKYREGSRKEKGLNWLSFCGYGAPYVNATYCTMRQIGGASLTLSVDNA